MSTKKGDVKVSADSAEPEEMHNYGQYVSALADLEHQTRQKGCVEDQQPSAL